MLEQEFHYFQEVICPFCVHQKHSKKVEHCSGNKRFEMLEETIFYEKSVLVRLSPPGVKMGHTINF